jgi:hypothetical protein
MLTKAKAKTKTKKTKGGDLESGTEGHSAAPTQQAGDHAPEIEAHSASQKQRRTRHDVKPQDAVSGEASDGPAGVTDPTHVARKNTADGDSPPATEARIAICQQLRELQRRRADALKSRIMIENRLVALVAQECGYSSGLDEKERKQRFDEARKVIKQIESGDEQESDPVTSRVSALVQSNLQSASGFDAYVSTCEKEMVKLAKQLPIAAWVEKPEQNGFGLKSLAIIIGECGDLNNYANPAKLWKRMGCAPFKGKMPSTWRSSKPGLTALEWTELGYSPWRRSVAWVIGDCLMKGNKTGPYRQRYDEAKAAAKVSHPDWTDGHAHNHALLLCVKRLLRDLWAEWPK